MNATHIVETVEAYKAFFKTPNGWAYRARRVRVGAEYYWRERLRLAAWLEARAVYNQERES